MSVRARVIAACFGLCLLAAGPASAQVTFQRGDVFASVAPGQVWIFRLDPATNTYLPILDLNTGQPTNQTTGSAFDRDGNFYVTTFIEGANNGSVVRFVKDFDRAIHTPLSLPTGATAPESVVFDATGRMYVGHARLPNDGIVLMSAAGAVLDTFEADGEGEPVTPLGTDWIDLASDQRTLFYTSEGRRIKRYDVVTRTQLADFADLSSATPAGRLFALRVLADGGVLVADNLNIKRLNAQGVVIQTYDWTYSLPDPHLCEANGAKPYDEWFSINLDPDGTSFWSGDTCSGEIHKFNIETGEHLAAIDTFWPTTLFGVAIFEEPTEGTKEDDGEEEPPPTTCECYVLGVQNATANSCSTLTLVARLKCDGTAIAGRTVSFRVGEYHIGDAVTDANGFAMIPGLMVPDIGGRVEVTLTASFAGDEEYAAITQTSIVVINPFEAPVSGDLESIIENARECTTCKPQEPKEKPKDKPKQKPKMKEKPAPKKPAPKHKY